MFFQKERKPSNQKLPGLVNSLREILGCVYVLGVYVGGAGRLFLALICIAPIRQIECKHKDYGIWNFKIQKKIFKN